MLNKKVVFIVYNITNAIRFVFVHKSIKTDCTLRGVEVRRVVKISISNPKGIVCIVVHTPYIGPETGFLECERILENSRKNICGVA